MPTSDKTICCLHNKTTYTAILADLPQLTSQHLFALSFMHLYPVLPVPVPISDEKWHMRASSYVLTGWQQLWDRETNFRSLKLHQPLCNLRCKSWTRLNRLPATMQKFGLALCSQWDCGAVMQMVKHVVEEPTMTRLEG